MASSTFKHRPRETNTIRALVIHESGGYRGPDGIIETLRGKDGEKGLGVHYIIQRNGVINKTAEANEIVDHAGTFSQISFGIELPNIVFESSNTKAVYTKRGLSEEEYESLRAPSNPVGRSVVMMNPKKQVESCFQLCRSLASQYRTIPLKVPVVVNGSYNWGFFDKKKLLAQGGIIAHGATFTSNSPKAHYDGFFAVFYMALRLAGLTADKAFVAAQTGFKSAKRGVPTNLRRLGATSPTSLGGIRAQSFVDLTRVDFSDASARGADRLDPISGVLDPSLFKYKLEEYSTAGLTYDFNKGVWVDT